MPLLARLYVRKKDLPKIDPKHRPEFRTKRELAVALLRWAKGWLGLWGQALWVVVDGAYAQGQRTLKPYSTEDFQQVVVAPTATASLHGDTVAAGMLFQQRECEAIEPGKVLSQMSLSDA